MGELIVLPRAKKRSYIEMNFLRAKRPLFHYHHSTFIARKPIYNKIMKGLYDQRGEKKWERVVVPFTHDADVLWCMADSGEEFYLNDKWSANSAYLMCLKYYPNELATLSSGMVIRDVGEYNEYLHEFNQLYERLSELRGNGSEGLATEDELIRLGFLFMVVYRTSQAFRWGLELDSSGCIKNEYPEGKSRMFTDLTLARDTYDYSRKLKKASISNMNWKTFFWRYAPKQDAENDIWFWHLPDTSSKSESEIAHEFTAGDIFTVTAEFIPALTARRSKVICTLPLETEHVPDFLRFNGLMRVDDDTYYKPGMKAHVNTCKVYGRKQMLILENLL